MPVSRRRRLNRKRAKRNKDYRQTVHTARVLAIRGKLTWETFTQLRAIAFGRLHGVAARLRTAVAPRAGAGAEG